MEKTSYQNFHFYCMHKYIYQGWRKCQHFLIDNGLPLTKDLTYQYTHISWLHLSVQTCPNILRLYMLVYSCLKFIPVGVSHGHAHRCVHVPGSCPSVCPSVCLYLWSYLLVSPCYQVLPSSAPRSPDFSLCPCLNSWCASVQNSHLTN